MKVTPVQSTLNKEAPQDPNNKRPAITCPMDIAAACSGRFSDPFGVLGPHSTPAGSVVRVYLPSALRVRIVDRDDPSENSELCMENETGFFSGEFPSDKRYMLHIEWPDAVQVTEDPYSFGPVLSDLDLHLFNQGCHWNLAKRFGASPDTHESVEGVRFAVWAPNAQYVSVVGDFNSWDTRRHPMRLHPAAGIWEIFVPRLTAGERYKFAIVGANGSSPTLKADPLARRTELPPATASIVEGIGKYDWTDGDWLANRAARQVGSAPISIYEVHAGSWLRRVDGDGGSLDWAELGDRLIPYVLRLGFTHIELLPIMEFPFGGSWGYQPLSLFAPTARLGDPAAFAAFIDACHDQGLGVILDWVPGHFPTDEHGMALFDGTHLYDHADPREGVQQDWNTLVFNLGRSEVQGYLIASAIFWLENFHVDGLRVDAVASMLYRDYSRAEGQWIPNVHGGRENLEAIAFLRRLNETVQHRVPGAIMIAEESTAWPGVSAPVDEGGLGFGFKWNMGWMHDSLSYLGIDPIYRQWHHHQLTFGLVYAFSERFVLPLSHDEVVHGKGSLYQRAPGDHWQKLANLRAYFAFMWTHPGKKLLFMGGEIGQRVEWNHDSSVDWSLLEDPLHAGLQRLVGELNRLYVTEAALHAGDTAPWGFEWLIDNDAADSVFAYLRRGAAGEVMLVVLNMTPVVRHDFRIGVPAGGNWVERLNTDAEIFGGSNTGNGGNVFSEPSPLHKQPWTVSLTLPPLGALILQSERPQLPE